MNVKYVGSLEDITQTFIINAALLWGRVLYSVFLDDYSLRPNSDNVSGKVPIGTCLGSTGALVILLCQGQSAPRCTPLRQAQSWNG